MTRLVLLAFASYLFASLAYADLNLPAVLKSSDNYAQTLEKSKRTALGSSADLLQDAKNARSEDDLVGVVDAYEALAAKNPQSYRAWLRLAEAWQASSPIAGHSIDAAYQSYRLAKSGGEKLQPLLIMSSVLRARLSREREELTQSLTRGQENQRVLQNLRETEPEVSDQRSSRRSHAPSSRAGRLKKSIRDQRKNTDTASLKIGQIASQLDEVYREIASLVDGLDTNELRLADGRSLAFDVFRSNERNEDDEKIPELKVRLVDDHAAACMRFTQPLVPEPNAYAGHVDLTKRDENWTFKSVTPSLEIKGHQFCLVGLSPGANYEAALKEGLPSGTGSQLKSGLRFEIEVPDRPERVDFQSRTYVLPASGSGEVPIFTTNVEEVKLQLLRITDRTLHRHIALGHVGGTMSGDEYDNLVNLFSDPVWSGTFTPKTVEGDSKNQTITSHIPVAELLKNYESWAKTFATNGHPAEERWRSREETVPPYGPAHGGLSGSFSGDSLSHGTGTTRQSEAGVYAIVVPDISVDPSSGRADELCEKSDNDDQDARCQNLHSQWFVQTDIGLSFYEANSKFYVIARSLTSGEAIADATIELVSASNRVLKTGTTDKMGVATFELRLTKGLKGNALVAVLAHAGNDFSFIRHSANRLDLSRLGVDGRKRPTAFDAFIHTDRGVYRPGNEIQLSVLVRDQDGKVPAVLHPMRVRLEANDRILAERLVEPKEWQLGGHKLSLRVSDNAEYGLADIKVIQGNSDTSVIGSTSIQIENFRPDRARLEFLDKGGPVWKAVADAANLMALEGAVSGQYLYAIEGASRQAPTKNVQAEIGVRIQPSESPFLGCYAGFKFGPSDAQPQPVFHREIAHTDEKGRVNLALTSLSMPDSQGPLSASVEVTLYDQIGPLATKSKQVQVERSHNWIGLASTPRLLPGKKAGTFRTAFDLVALTGQNEPLMGRKINYSVKRETDVYTWERSDAGWQHRKTTQTTPVDQPDASGSVVIGPNAVRGGPNDCLLPQSSDRIVVELPLGRYVLSAQDPESGVKTETRFHTGSVTADLEDLQPNMLAVSSEKSNYGRGDKIRIGVESPFDGPVLVALVEDDVFHWEPGIVRNGVATVEFDVKEDWLGKGVYALATVYRGAASAAETSFGPARAIGASYFTIVGAKTAYDVQFSLVASDGTRPLPRQVPPFDTLELELCLSEPQGGCLSAPPEEAYAVVYLVDEGLLNLTTHPVPDPRNHFFGQRKLGLSIWDNYDRLILKEGGDRPNRLALSNYFSDRIVSMSQGPVKLSNGKGRFKFQSLGNFESSVKVVAVAWSADHATGFESDGMSVRGPLVVQLGTPPFLSPGDRPTLPLRLENLDFAHEGAYGLKLDPGSALKLRSFALSDGKVLTPDETGEFKIELKRGQPVIGHVEFELDDKVQEKQADVRATLRPIGTGLKLKRPNRDWNIAIRKPLSSSVETVHFRLEPGQGPVGLSELVSDLAQQRYKTDTLRVSASFSHSPLAVLPNRGAKRTVENQMNLERLIWAGMGILGAGAEDLRGSETQQLLSRIVDEVQSLQMADGSFLPHRPIGEFTRHELGFELKGRTKASPKRFGLFRTSMALDFLERTKKAGLVVRASTTKNAVKFLKYKLREHQKPDPAEEGSPCAPYTIFAALSLVAFDVLDDENITQIRQCHDNKNTSDRAETMVAKAMVAAVLAEYGETKQARVVLANIAEEAEFGLQETDDLRLAMMLSLLKRAGAESELTDKITRTLLAPGKSVPNDPAILAWLSTAAGEDAAGGDIAPGKPKISFTDETQELELQSDHQGRVLATKKINFEQLNTKAFRFENSGTKEVTVAVSFEGDLLAEEQSSSAGHALKRRFYRLQGRSCKKIDLNAAKPKLGETLLVVLEADNEALPASQYSPRHAVSDRNDAYLLVDFLPANFEIVHENGFERNLSRCDGLSPIGSLRTVRRGDDRIAFVVLPKSKQPAEQNDRPNNTETDLDIRLAYIVRVNASDQYTMPGTIVETLHPPLNTYRAPDQLVSIDRPVPSAR